MWAHVPIIGTLICITLNVNHGLTQFLRQIYYILFIKVHKASREAERSRTPSPRIPQQFRGGNVSLRSSSFRGGCQNFSSRGWQGRGRRQWGTRSCHSPTESPEIAVPVGIQQNKLRFLSRKEIGKFSVIGKYFFSMNKEKELRFASKVGMWGEGNRAERRGSQDRAHGENLSSTHCKCYRFSWRWELWAVLRMSPAAGSDKWHFTALWIFWQCMAGAHLDSTHVLKPKHMLKCFADQGSEKLCLWFF